MGFSIMELTFFRCVLNVALRSGNRANSCALDKS
jgi:hypothetical protein